MWKYEKVLQRPVKVGKCDVKMAKFLNSLYGGPDGELSAALRYMNHRYSMPDRIIGLLTDISTEELGHLEMIATMIYNLDYLLDLDIVTIGGGISQQPFLIQTIQKQFHDLRKQYKEDDHEPVIKACQFQNEANLLGALYHFHTKKGG